MTNRSKILIIALVLITIGIIFLAVSPKKSSYQATQTTVTPTDDEYYKQSKLSFSPTAQQVTTNNQAALDVIVKTNTNKVTGAQLEIQYNPEKLSNPVITPGTFFNNPVVLVKEVKKLESDKGIINYMIVEAVGKPGKQGEGVVAHITFTPLKAATTKVTFGKNTIVTAEGILKSVLKKKSSATLLIKNPGSSK